MKIRESKLMERKEEAQNRASALREVREKQMKERQVMLMKEKEQRQAEMKSRIQERQLAMKERQLKLKTSELDPPPPPRSPLDFTVDMAKRGATFYYDGKQISSDEAVKLLKTKKDIHVSAKGSQSKNPVVHLSSLPLEIRN